MEQPWRMNLRLLGEGTVREFGMGVYTVMYLKQIIPRTYCVAQGTLLNVRCQPGWEGSLGEKGYMCTCMAESLPCSPETVTRLLISYIPKQNKRFKVKKKGGIEATGN